METYTPVNKSSVIRTLFLLLVVTLPFLAGAQQVSGGFGHGYFGVSYNFSSALQSDLRAASILGNDLQLNKVVGFGGGEGFGLFGNGILIGGGGFGYKASDATTKGQATLSMGGGLLKVGYVTSMKTNYFCFPYIGIGGQGMQLEIRNNTSDQTFYLDNQAVPPSESITLQSGGLCFELGYALHFLTFSIPDVDSGGGFIVGIQAGTFLFTSLEEWQEESTDEILPSFNNGFALSPYVRLTIGGGGFKKEQ